MDQGSMGMWNQKFTLGFFKFLDSRVYKVEKYWPGL